MGLTFPSDPGGVFRSGPPPTCWPPWRVGDWFPGWARAWQSCLADGAPVILSPHQVSARCSLGPWLARFSHSCWRKDISFFSTMILIPAAFCLPQRTCGNVPMPDPFYTLPGLALDRWRMGEHTEGIGLVLYVYVHIPQEMVLQASPPNF